jgi:hypothetical protein
VAVDTLSRRARLEAKQAGSFAPRHKVWPPEGYVAPTAEEFDALRQMARRYSGTTFQGATWKHVSDDQVLRRYQLAEVIGDISGHAQAYLYAYTRALRDELRRRGLVHRSIAVLRCEACSHASERLFEATQETHPGLENRSGTRVPSAWFCARCWSGDDVADEDSEQTS